MSDPLDDSLEEHRGVWWILPANSPVFGFGGGWRGYALGADRHPASSQQNDGCAPCRSRTQLPSHQAQNAVQPSALQSLDALRHLAEQGDATAQFALGIRYATGNEVKQDYTEAARWFSLAAERGEVKAQSVLAAYYWDGTGVPKDL